MTNGAADPLEVVFLYTAPPSAAGGYEVFASRIAEGLSRDGFRVRHINTGKWLVRHAYRISGLGDWDEGDDDFVSLRSARRMIRSADVVYLKNDVLDLVIAALVLQHTPSVVGFHTSISREVTGVVRPLRKLLYGQMLYRRLLLRRRRLYHVLHGAGWTELSQRLGKGEYFRTVNNAPPEGWIAGVNSVNTRRHAESVVRFLFVGRLTRQKGADLLPSIAEGLQEQYGDRVQLVVAGEGDLASAIRDCAAIKYLGRVDDVRAEMALAHWLLVPSRWEVAPLVLLESICMGLPAIIGVAPELRWASMGEEFTMASDSAEAALAACRSAVRAARSATGYRAIVGNVRALVGTVPTQQDSVDGIAALFREIAG